MHDSIYTLEEQVELGKILDDFITYNEEQFLLLGEEIKYDMFLEAVTGGSVSRAVKYANAAKNRADKRISTAVDKTVDAAIDGDKKAEIKSIREDLMRGRGKVSTLIKRAIKVAISAAGISVAAGAGASLTPALALIGFAISTLRRREISKKERDKILFEMKQELEIVEEKIKDAESDGNKQLKYKYMRIRAELNRNIGQLRTYGKIQQR